MEASGAALLTDADDAPPGAPGRYQRHRPEQTLLYQVIAQHYPNSTDCDLSSVHLTRYANVCAVSFGKTGTA